MSLRNGEHGYGPVTKWLHWLTFAALAAQFAVGYTMDADAGTDRIDDRLDARAEACEAEDDAAEERCEEAVERSDERLESTGDYVLDDGALGLLDLHVGLGLAILLLALLRVAWRRTGLPPWAETLSERERTLAHWTERVLLATLFVIPLSGLLLLFASDDWLPLHVAGHVAFFVALAAHLGLVLKHQLVDRDGLLRRMT